MGEIECREYGSSIPRVNAEEESMDALGGMRRA